ncbi:nucleoside-diphosphate sugar epimerase/dehydratase [Hoeflea prorocentri]|uniref:Nucleoside-diphosphate sugar epimerase/dehydratase n=1 Tax=Hoeflea prorocentri TaxID=1922333 RepID=A0A9X3UFC0_9HYPH|nr:nucleoside-diphosphate sugar epimerase/dehydratase [Hoeflea prorocentri]MCY6379855.1 nucleoside-diphosphate sugar epimerase/dehydratase [Hoeflea prorocentri]MDA5397655.1 nucleoside-diphosphate sugar epimerase/dehydratase [Hoeflea prorocentri]
MKRLLQSFNQSVLEMGRHQKRALFMLVDATAIVSSLFAAMLFLYGRLDIPGYSNLTWLLFALPVVGIAINYFLGLYDILIRAMESRTIGIVAAGATAMTFFVAAASYMDSGINIPRSVPPIFGILVFISIGVIRVLARAYYQRVNSSLNVRENVLIYGAGSAGTQLAAAMQSGNHQRVVAFIDDDPTLKGTVIRGCRVHGVEKIGQLQERYNVKRVLFAIANASPSQRRAVVARLAPYKLELQTIPSLSDILRGRAELDELKKIRIEDLLGRTAISPMPQLFDEAIKGKSILVTGAGGSIGSELCRQILKANPKKLVLLEISELSLYNVEKRLRRHTPANTDLEIIYTLGDVRDRQRVRTLLTRHHIDIVYHAAAYKHVPIVEANPSQGISNNIFGTLTVAQEAVAAGVERFILVSTDKAVRPSNVMGASKRLAEQVVQNLQTTADTTVFSIVRFGNVLGSSGSVINLFREQIASGGPVTVTHENVTRYFMTIQEAAQLVVQAGTMAVGGEVFVLDMGRAGPHQGSRQTDGPAQRPHGSGCRRPGWRHCH